MQVSVNNIFTVFGYYFSSKKTILFNPAAVLMLGIKFKKIENKTKQLLADTNNMNWAIGVINRVHAYKNIGITFGIVLDTWNFHDFNENNELVGGKRSIILKFYEFTKRKSKK